VRLGDKPVHERTDPDYYEKKLAKMAIDYRDCPDEWKGVFIAGIDTKDLKELQDRGFLPKGDARIPASQKPNSKFWHTSDFR
jgi:hypothetical protein